MVAQCGVCDAAPSKYKCPACILPYCSLACFKNHKETCIPKQQQQQQQQQQQKQDQGSVEQQQGRDDRQERHHEQPIRDFAAGTRLERTQFEAIAKSGELCDMLKQHPELQERVRMIDASRNAEDELAAALQEPPFKAFVDRLLSIVNLSV